MSSLNQLFDTLFAWVNEQTVQHRRPNVPAAVSSIERLEPRALLSATPINNYQSSLALSQNYVANGAFPSSSGGGSAQVTLGQIRTYAFGGNSAFLPHATGQTLTIAQNAGSYSLTSNRFGGDGLQNFQLPNLAGTAAIGAGQGAGLPTINLGQQTGTASVTLTTSNLPPSSVPFSDYQPSLGLTYAIVTSGTLPFGANSDLGDIVAFAGNFAPDGTTLADGRLLQISQYSALFSLFGTTYGGNGTTTFALPDLRGRTIVGTGNGVVLGQTVGQSTVTLNAQQAAGSAAFDNREPSLGLNFLIATSGIYPAGDFSPDTTTPFIGEVKATAISSSNFSFLSGWLPADGRLLSTTDYSALFALIGTTYGGDGVTNFALPDLRGRTVIGTGNLNGTNFSLGQVVGSNSVTLTPSQIPSATTAPTITVNAATNIQSTTATIGGNITADGGATITKRGVLFAKTSVNANPTFGGTGVIEVDDPTNGTGIFGENISGLTPLTGYSFVAFATNSVGTTVSTPISTFTSAETPSLIVNTNQDVSDAFDGKTTLREAIAYAATLTGPQTITFGDGSTVGGINFTDGQAHTITLSGTQLDITSNLTIAGLGANLLTISGNNQSRVFQIDNVPTAVATITGVTITGGKPGAGSGGGIRSFATLTLDNDVITNNFSTNVGGGVSNLSGTLTITNTTITNNTSLQGGGINSNQGNVTLMGDLIASNTATVNGGGIATTGTSGTLFASNVTIFDNSATGNKAANAGVGGGVIIFAGTFTSRNNTIIGNTANSGQAGGIECDGTIAIYNTLDSGNNGSDFVLNNGIASADFTFFTNRDITKLVVTDVNGKAVLADNGGPTKTIALIANSSAINAGKNANAIDAQGNALTTDQRGLSRISGGTADVGAFEFQFPSVTAAPAGNVTSNSVTLGGTVTQAGDGPISKRGVLYAKTADNANPTLGGTGVIEVDDPTNGLGDFSENITGLTPLTGYTFVAFATNSAGTTYSSPASTFQTHEVPSLIVNTAQDVADPFDNLTSLREAIAFADSLSGNQTITFAQSLSGSVINLTSSLPTITTTTTIEGDIDGNSTPDITISGDVNKDDIHAAGSAIITDIGASKAQSKLGDNVRIFNATAALTLDGVVLTGGVSSHDRGGAVNANDVTINHSTITGNRAEGGGGVYATGEFAASDSTISGNSSIINGAGVYAIRTATVTNSTFSGNAAQFEGGGLIAFGAVTVNNSTFANNFAHGRGGGILAFNGITVSNSTFSANSTQSSGGGISVTGGAIATNSTFSGNSSSQSGGGGIDANGTVTVSNSTFAGNSTQSSGGGISSNNVVTVSNSTFVGNSSGFGGAGIVAGVAAIVNNSTFTGNFSLRRPGPQSFASAVNSSNVTLANSILLGNSSPNGDAEVSGPLTLLGNNIVGGNIFSGSTQTGTTTLSAVFAAVGADPNTGVQSGLLGNNGGPTQTVALAANSPAINAGVNANAVDANNNPLTTDQRGLSRIAGSAVDLGAFEFQLPAITATPATNITSNAATLGGTVTQAGDGPITKRGILYAKTADNANPTLGGTGVIEVDDPTNGTGAFSENITGLTPLTGYSFVAFATNGAGTVFSNPVSTFKTPEAPSLKVTTNQDVVDAFDGKTSLREAILYANSLTGPQTITFGDGSAVGGINFTDGQAHTITLTGGQINITSSVTIQGQGNAKTVIDGGWSGGNANDGSRIFKIDDGTATQQTVTINDLTLQHANAGTGNFIFNGGAIQNSERLFLNRDVITGNQGNQGGGIANIGAVISTGDIFSGNVAPTGGGGIFNSSSGIFTSINDAVVNNNKLVHADGGGIYNVGSGFNLINGTVANNSGISGGGIINFGTLNVTNSTIANNSATQGGGLFHGIGDTWNMSNSILADNTGGDVFVNGQTTTTAKFSIIGDRSYSGPGVLNQQTLTAAQLFVTDNSGHARLANNGGPTPTIALSANSVALDAGSNALAVDANNAPLTKDQRGQSRIAAGTVDLGAFESQTIAVSFSVQDKTYDGKAFVNPQVTTLPIGPAAAGSSLNLTFTYYSGSTANPANKLPGAPTNAGSYLLVVTASQDGYHTGTAQAAFKINKANATISVTPYNVPYDGQPHTATGAAKGVNGETLAGLDLSKTNHTIAGNYTTDSWSFSDVTGNYNNVAATTIADQITRLSPTLTLTPGPQLILGSGAKFSASATLAGGVGETGKLTFTLTNSAGTALFTQDVTVNGNGVYTPTNVPAPTVDGTYFWAVSYNGDQNHFGATVAKGPTTTESVIGLGITNNNGTLYVVGTGAGDKVVVTANGAKLDGSTGVKIVATLNGVSTTTTYNAPLTSLNFFEFGSFATILLPDRLSALPTFTTLADGTYNVHLSNANAKVVAGNGNFNQITVGNGTNSITVGNGNGAKIIAGNGNNTITIGNGNSNSIFAGHGNNVIVEGNGMTNAITVGNGNNFIVGGLGSHNISAGNGINIVINGAATLTSANDSFAAILNDFVTGKAPAVGSIRPRLKITYATVAGSKLNVGTGLNWFFVNNPSTTTNRKPSDVLTNS